jgi:hypothetical protein
MPLIKDKSHVIQRLHTERRRLELNLSRLSPEVMLQPGVVGMWSVKDILAHLYDWETRLGVWLEAARNCEPDNCPDPDFTWRQIDQLNEHIYLTHRDEPLDAVLQAFRDTHLQFMQLVEAMPEEEMLTPSFYAFTEEKSIFDWLHGFAAHDMWGKKMIRRWLKSQGRET